MSEKDLRGSRIVGGNSAYKRNESDFYPTPPDATTALVDFLELEKDTVVWECACGQGHMTRVLESAGYHVIATDIQSGTDYLDAETPEGIEWVITNPPFSLAKEFIVKSFERGLPFAFLLKAHFWNAKSRYALFYAHPPTYILPLTWRPDFMFQQRGGGSPLLDVMWCVWIPGMTQTLFRPLSKPSMKSEPPNEGAGT